ncbi:MAG: TRAP transporter large permease subunit [Clostridia bacterium]|nr:TRAP transporter large permease subunit [Clostridia bacterium]
MAHHRPWRVFLLGELLNSFGAGQFFVDIAFALTGRMKGGPAAGAVADLGRHRGPCRQRRDLPVLFPWQKTNQTCLKG